jgi:hypothetical protein
MMEAKPDTRVDWVKIPLHEPEEDDVEVIEYDEIDEDEWERL